jgi:hypothetical protein
MQRRGSRSAVDVLPLSPAVTRPVQVVADITSLTSLEPKAIPSATANRQSAACDVADRYSLEPVRKSEAQDRGSCLAPRTMRSLNHQFWQWYRLSDDSATQGRMG